MKSDRTNLDGAHDPIDLARESAFTLGHLCVIPSARTVETGGWSQRLEPRVMQVLVLLSQECPRVVGRAELNARVWAGRIVGDEWVCRHAGGIGQCGFIRQRFAHILPGGGVA